MTLYSICQIVQETPAIKAIHPCPFHLSQPERLILNIKQIYYLCEVFCWDKLKDSMIKHSWFLPFSFLIPTFASIYCFSFRSRRQVFCINRWRPAVFSHSAFSKSSWIWQTTQKYPYSLVFSFFPSSSLFFACPTKK